MLVRRIKIPKCACGCGNLVTKGRKGYNTYMTGHDSRNKNKIMESKDCVCGCGGKTKPGNNYIRGHNKQSEEVNRKCSERMKGNQFRKGLSLSTEAKLKLSNNWSGKNHPMWNGGKMVIDGYIRIWCLDHPHNKKGYVKEERLVMEELLGRYLLPSEVVHHKNEVRNDNRIENLELFPNRSEHMRYHTTKRWKENGGVRRVKINGNQ